MPEMNQSGLAGGERQGGRRFKFRRWIEHFIVNENGRILARQRGMSMNISRGGMAINSPRKLEPGTTLIMRVPGKKERDGFAVTGLSIRWSEPIESDEHQFRAGGAFVNVPAAFSGLSWDQLIGLWTNQPEREPITKVQPAMPASAAKTMADAAAFSRGNS